MFRPDLAEEQVIARLSTEFNLNTPVRHLVIDNFIDADIAHAIFSNFPSMEKMKTHYKGLNEKKAEHSDLSSLHPAFSKLHESLSSSFFINWMEKVTGINRLETIEDRLGYGLHQGADKSFLDIHIDYNLHPAKKLYRKLNLIFFVNKEWQRNWGGDLELWDADVRNCIQSIQPLFNRCVIFECSNISYHGYSRINVPAGITRKSCYQYYFTPVDDNVSFHDTIFKPRPHEPLLKKITTYSKDFAKNTAKKVLLKLGWKRLLK